MQYDGQNKIYPVNTASSEGHKDKSFRYCSLKSQKILSAAYLITDVLEDHEPIKVAIRKEAIGMVDSVSDVFFGSRGQIPKSIDRALALRALLYAAGEAGMISPMNVQVVGDEITNLIEEIDRAYFSRLSIIPLAHFRTPEPERSESPTGAASAHYQGNVQEVQKRESEEGVARVSFKAERGEEKNEVTKAAGTADHKKTKQKDRRAIILSLLHTKDKLTVKDISEVITDYSEKTIQRELMSMVDAGLLKKEGERRWSTYRLAA